MAGITVSALTPTTFANTVSVSPQLEETPLEEMLLDVLLPAEPTSRDLPLDVLPPVEPTSRELLPVEPLMLDA